MEKKPAPKRFGILGLAVCALGVSLLIPWAFHMGGRLTPLYWSGTGMLVTNNGTYPLYILIYPTMHRSNGLDGWGFLCTSRNTVVPLDVNGRFESGLWTWSLEDTSMELGLSEPLGARRALLDPTNRGGFELLGGWQGKKLVLRENGEHLSAFRSGFKVEHASVTLTWGSKSHFEEECSNAPVSLPANSKH